MAASLECTSVLAVGLVLLSGCSGRSIVKTNAKDELL
jgi:hypothetical protein